MLARQRRGKSKLAALTVPLIKRIPGEMLRLYLRNILAQKLGIIDQRQLDNLIPQETPKQPSAVEKNVKFKRTPMRLLIALLLQNPQLAQLDYDLASLSGLQESGFELFQELTKLCRENIGITLGQILEYWRDSPQSKPLEILALWDHLIEEDKIEQTFCDTLAYLYIQFIEQRIEQLIAKDRQDGLDITEKQELVQLLNDKQQNNNS